MNTGWTGGGLGVGRKLICRALVVLSTRFRGGLLTGQLTQRDPVFGLETVCRVPGVSERLLVPWNASQMRRNGKRQPDLAEKLERILFCSKRS